jgi:hypothetical protein
MTCAPRSSAYSFHHRLTSVTFISKVWAMVCGDHQGDLLLREELPEEVCPLGGQHSLHLDPELVAQILERVGLGDPIRGRKSEEPSVHDQVDEFLGTEPDRLGCSVYPSFRLRIAESTHRASLTHHRSFRGGLGGAFGRGRGGFDVAILASRFFFARSCFLLT